MSVVVEIKDQRQADSIFRSGYKIVVIDHYAEWCYPCKMVAPKYEELANQYSNQNILFAKCNADLRLFPVGGLPTFELYVDGQKVETVTGADIERVRFLIQQLSQNPSQPVSQLSLSNQQQPPHQPPQMGQYQNVAPPTENKNPYSIGNFKQGTRGKGGNYASYSQL